MSLVSDAGEPASTAGAPPGVELALAAAALGCLGEAAEASLVSRLFSLDGLAAVGLGAEEDARAAFARALQFAPGLAWDERFDPSKRAPFDAATAAVAALPRFALLIGPGVEQQAAIWVDGRPVDAVGGRAELAVGRHLVQILRPVSVEGRTWRRGDVWELLPVAPVAPAARQTRTGATLTWIGLGAAVAGGIGAASTWPVAWDNHCAADEGDDNATRQANLNALAPWAWGSTAVAASGMGIALAGQILVLQGRW